MSLLEVNYLSIEFRSGGAWQPVVSDVSFRVEKGEILALVGESGCGKSVSCLSLARLLPEGIARYASGEIIFDQEGRVSRPLAMNRRELRRVRGGGIAYIFQEPSASLNPVFRVGDQIIEALELHRSDITDYEAEAEKLLQQVGIPEPKARLRNFPHEMSGGMQQRVMIAMALAGNPALLVADEPTTALDVTIQAQILDLLKTIRSQRDMAIILVTHNLGIVAEMADRVAVMYAGRIVETAPAAELISSPAHPYTKALLAAVPRLHHDSGKLTTIPGIVPQPKDFPAGCRFAGRCLASREKSAEFQQRCLNQMPPCSEVSPAHFSYCYLNSPEETP